MNRVSPVLVLSLAVILASSVGCARKPDDTKIASDIQSKYSQDSGLSSKQLTVKASDGVVTLSGYVDNDAQRTAAALQAASVAGVKEVVNNVQVGSPAPAPSAAGTNKKTMQPAMSSLKRPGKRAKLGHSGASQDTMYEIAPTPVGARDDGTAENSQPPSSPAQVAPPSTTTPSTPAAAMPSPRKITIEQGTPVSIRLIDSIDSEKNQVGDTFHASLNTPLSAEGTEAIPAGTDVTGHIVELRSAGKFKGQSLIVLQLDSITANGRSYTLQTDQYRKEGSSRGKNTAEKVGGGAIIGGIIGAIAGGGKGAAIGSAAGAGVGGGAQAASKPKPIKLSSETVLNFTLKAPVTVLRPQSPNAGRQRLGDAQ